MYVTAPDAHNYCQTNQQRQQQQQRQQDYMRQSVDAGIANIAPVTATQHRAADIREQLNIVLTPGPEAVPPAKTLNTFYRTARGGVRAGKSAAAPWPAPQRVSRPDSRGLQVTR